jgi:hypothetical protein
MKPQPDFWAPPEGLREPSESFPEVEGDVMAGPIVEAPEPPVRPRESHWWYFPTRLILDTDDSSEPFPPEDDSD